MRKKKIGAWKIVYLQSPISSRGHSTKREPQRGIATFQFPSHKTHKTSHINSNLRIWQSYSRVPQILKVLCAWYTGKKCNPHWIRAPQILLQCVLIQYSSCIWTIWGLWHYPRIVGFWRGYSEIWRDCGDFRGSLKHNWTAAMVNDDGSFWWMMTWQLWNIICHYEISTH